jgi:sigma-E factor negative regulatory protein RseC
MLTETGRVVAVDGEGVWVETIRQSTCGSCALRKGCGHGLLNRNADGQYAYIRVLPGRIEATDCRVDDQVRIVIPEEVILRGSLVVYLLPLLFLICGACIGEALATPAFAGSVDLAAMTGALTGLAIGAVLVRRHAQAHQGDRRLQPTLLQRL